MLCHGPRLVVHGKHLTAGRHPPRYALTQQKPLLQTSPERRSRALRRRCPSQHGAKAQYRALPLVAAPHLQRPTAPTRRIVTKIAAENAQSCQRRGGNETHIQSAPSMSKILTAGRSTRGTHLLPRHPRRSPSISLQSQIPRRQQRLISSSGSMQRSAGQCWQCYQ